MSRNNISVLLATALLGILLWVVLSMARDFARAPAEPLPFPDETKLISFDPALPRINNASDFSAWLTQFGYSAELSGQHYCSWLNERGFTSGPQQLGPSACKPRDSAYKELVDSADTALLNAAANGNALAFQILAERSLQTDPLAAMEWYEQAVINGSVYAMIRISDLLTTLASPKLASFVSDPVWNEALQTISSESPPPQVRALAWSVAAIIVGGYSVLDSVHAERLSNLAAGLDDSSIDLACETAQNYVLESAAARRARGAAVFTTATPELAISINAPELAIPCNIPVLPLVSLAQCQQEIFVAPGPKLMNAWLCPAD